jgi:hypothetical protein
METGYRAFFIDNEEHFRKGFLVKKSKEDTVMRTV